MRVNITLDVTVRNQKFIATGTKTVTFTEDFILVPCVGDFVDVDDTFEGKTYKFEVTSRMITRNSVTIFGKIS